MSGGVVEGKLGDAVGLGGGDNLGYRVADMGIAVVYGGDNEHQSVDNQSV